MKNLILYTDGACSGNPGPGGWGVIVDFNDGKVQEYSGGEANTTNNRMELTAVIQGLKVIVNAVVNNGPCTVDLFSDSKYVIDALKNGWVKNWRQNNWRKSDGKPALNADLWEKLLSLVDMCELNYHWIKGHADNPMNNRCDELAVSEWQKIKTQADMSMAHIKPAANTPNFSFKTTMVKTKTVTESVELDENDIFNWLTDCTNAETLKMLGHAALRYAHEMENGGGGEIDPLS